MHLVGVKALKEELLPCLGYRPLHKCPGRASGESQRGEPESGPGLHCHCSAEADQASYLSNLVTSCHICHSEAMLTNMSTEIAQKRRPY